MLLKEQINQAFELFDRGYLVESEELYNKCLSRIEDLNSDEYNQVLHGLGYVKASLNKFDEARNLYKELITIALSENNKMNHCIAVHQVGMVERMAENYDEALNTFQLEATLLKDYEIDSALNWSANFYEQGYVFLKMGNIESAQQLMDESLQFARQSKDAISMGCAYRGFGEIYQTKGEALLAKQSFHKAKDAFKRANDHIAMQEIDKLLSK